VHNNYYKPAFQKIVDFQIDYAATILNYDNVVVIVDKDTKPFYEEKLPDDVLITAEVFDIWMRDFTTVNPIEPTQFQYTWASMSKKQSIETQESFADFADKYGINRKQSNLIIDGGNIVDNYGGKYITTTRFAKDNKLSIKEAKEKLKETLNAKEVAILEPDEEVLAHSDGMVMWLDEKTLLVNQYTDKAFRKLVLDELTASFPDTNIIEVPVEYGKNKRGEWEGFESACGVNLNSVLTFKNIYVPVFGMTHDKKAVEIIRQNTDKTVLEIDAKGVCPMGGSVRCLTWQLTGENAEKLIQAAREN
ncbi:MAG: agmatine deiminase family protein, partial [Pyrinomonadaceae bacterium]|nr:agmatine deiminase family protein [Pyrinomonadaceae bacterium]